MDTVDLFEASQQQPEVVEPAQGQVVTPKPEEQSPHGPQENSGQEGSGERDGNEPGNSDLFNGNGVEPDGEYQPTEHDYALDYLASRGFIEMPEGADFSQYTDEDLDGYIQSGIEATIQRRLAEQMNALPPIVREMNQYVAAGGDPAEFFNAISQRNQTGIYEGMDLSSAENQEYVIRATLQGQGRDDKFINSYLEFLRSNNQLESEANATYRGFMAQRQAELQEMVQQQQEEAYAHEQRQQAIKYQLNRAIQGREEIMGLPLSVDDKRSLASYMVDPAYTLEDGTVITSLQKDLYFDIMQNQEVMLQLALLLKNRNKDGTLNLGRIERGVQTRVARGVRSNFRRTASTPNAMGGGTASYEIKSLADQL